jgi:hypothetical protein
MHIFLFFIALMLLPVASFGQTVLFKADGESGTMKPPWGTVGELMGGGLTPTTSTTVAKNGTKSYKFEISSPSSASGNKSMTYIFPNLISSGKPSLYYSAWYYIAAGYNDPEWRNNFQWKTNNGLGSTIKGGPKTRLRFDYIKNVLQVKLGVTDCEMISPTGGGSSYQCEWQQPYPRPVPRNKWFHIEVFYKAAKTNGQIIVWQDGVEVFNISAAKFDTLTRWSVDYPKLRSDNTDLYWNIGHYSGPKTVGRQLIYADYALITDYRVFSNQQTQKLTGPTNLRIESLTE